MIKATSIEKYFEERKVLGKINLNIKDGEIVYLLGESGSGKSTLLNILAGLEDAEKGTVRVNDNKITGPANNLVPGYKNISHVSQDFKLDPFLTVFEFMARKVPYLSNSAKQKKIKKLLRVCGLSKRIDAKPDELSGGEQQRIALATALINEPDVVLLDEPFSNLDIPLKRKLRYDIIEILKAKEVTSVVVSHDSYEAMAVADRIAILRKGKLVQFSTPQVLFEKPRSIYAASFLGEINKIKINQETHLIRPTSFQLHKDGTFEGIVTQCIYQGANYHVHVKSEISDHALLIHSKSPILVNKCLRFSINV